MFKERSNKKELLDGKDIPASDLRQNLRELHQINLWLGGYSASLNGLKKVLSPKKSSIIVDLGCGGGDTLLTIRKWGLKKKYNIQLKGIDINPECIRYCNERTTDTTGLQFICDDYRKVKDHVPDVDVLHASLFCHHLCNDEILELLHFARSNKLMLVINDLQRHPLAYYSIKLITRLMSKSRLVKNDAPLSVLRGFSTKEWQNLLMNAGISEFKISKRWAFRHEIVIWP